MVQKKYPQKNVFLRFAETFANAQNEKNLYVTELVKFLVARQYLVLLMKNEIV
ncbi:MAG: hypothetical protein FWC11_04760 [Firmicutes bacterium]|nr:hypothetical protein [Bacillota bacterium]